MAAEELLEKCAETRPIEIKFRSLSGTSVKSAFLLRCLPFRLVPVSSQFIIYLRRLSGSLKTSLASLISLTLPSALVLSFATSG
jgi:hypothetical protein